MKRYYLRELKINFLGLVIINSSVSNMFSFRYFQQDRKSFKSESFFIMQTSNNPSFAIAFGVR